MDPCHEKEQRWSVIAFEVSILAIGIRVAIRLLSGLV